MLAYALETRRRLAWQAVRFVANAKRPRRGQQALLVELCAARRQLRAFSFRTAGGDQQHEQNEKRWSWHWKQHYGRFFPQTNLGILSNHEGHQ